MLCLYLTDGMCVCARRYADSVAMAIGVGESYIRKEPRWRGVNGKSNRCLGCFRHAYEVKRRCCGACGAKWLGTIVDSVARSSVTARRYFNGDRSLV